MSDTISLRIKTKSYTLTASPRSEAVTKSLREDIKVLGRGWAQNLGLKPEIIVKAECEFVLQSTLDYIEQLEIVLQRLQSDPDTSDELLDEIERVLN